MCRAAADALRNEPFGDYLPLPIAERKRRRLNDGRPENGGSRSQEAAAEEEGEAGEASASGSGSGNYVSDLHMLPVFC